MSCFTQEIVFVLNVHQNTRFKVLSQTGAYVNGKKKMVEAINSKKPRERKTGFSLQTPKRHSAPSGFLLGSFEAPRPMTKWII